MIKTVSGVTGHKQDYRSFSRSPRLVSSNIFIGVEVELEGVPPTVDHTIDDSCLIERVVDHSLRGNSAIELRFTTPLSGGDILTALHNIEKFATTNNNIPVLSSRTSTHVHIDVRDLTIQQLKYFVATYIAVERILFKYCGTERETSPYCVPLYSTSKAVDGLRTIFDASNNYEHFSSANSICNGDMRYSALNLNALYKFGTLEFRLHKGEYRADKLVRWVNIIMKIKEYAVSVPPREVLCPKHTDSHKCAAYIDSVFGEYADVLKYAGYEHAIVEGARLSSEVLKIGTTNSLWDLLGLVNNSKLKLGKEV